MTRHTASYVEQPGTVDVPGRLRGTWRNQLGSELILEPDPEGRLCGRYRSGTGEVAGTSYPITGSYDPEPAGPAVVLGFVVDWTAVHSVTAWSGQFQPADDSISATWIMTTEADRDEAWSSTRIGQDRFRRSA